MELNSNIIISNNDNELIIKKIKETIQNDKKKYISKKIKEKSLFGIGCYNIEKIKDLVFYANLSFYIFILLVLTLSLLNIKVFKMDKDLMLYSIVLSVLTFISALCFSWIPLKRKVVTVLFYETKINKVLDKYLQENINNVVLNYLKIKSSKKEISYEILSNFIRGKFDDEIRNEMSYMLKIKKHKELVNNVWEILDASK